MAEATLSNSLDLSKVTTTGSGTEHPHSQGVTFSTTATYNTTGAAPYISAFTIGNDAVLTLTALAVDAIYVNVNVAGVPTLTKFRDALTLTDVAAENSTVVVTKLNERLGTDLSGLDTNLVKFDLGSIASTQLTAAAKIGSANLQVFSSTNTPATLDISLLTNENLEGTQSITLGTGTTLIMTAAQAEYLSAAALSITGAGAVVILDIDLSLDADLSGITPDGGMTIEVQEVVVAAGPPPTTTNVTTFTGELGDVDISVVKAAGAGAGPFMFDVTGGTLGFTGDNDVLTVGTDVVLRLTAAQAASVVANNSGPASITGAGAVVITDIHLTEGADLGSVAPVGGVTIELSDDATLTGAASLGDADLTLTKDGAGPFTLDVTSATLGFTGGDDHVVLSADTTLRMKAVQVAYVDLGVQGASVGDTGPKTITGAGDLTVTSLVNAETLDLNHVTNAGTVTLERGGINDDKFTVNLAEESVFYALEGDRNVGGDFKLIVDEPSPGKGATVLGFGTGNTADAFDLLDFSSIQLSGSGHVEKVTSNVFDFTKGITPSKTDFDAGDYEVVIFRSGSSESAETIATEFAQNVNSDYVSAGSVNDLLDLGESMIFGIRTDDVDTGGDIFNFWLWKDGVGGNDGAVQASELTLLVSLVELQNATSLTSSNIVYSEQFAV
jgi:hypothetical protein